MTLLLLELNPETNDNVEVSDTFFSVCKTSIRVLLAFFIPAFIILLG